MSHCWECANSPACCLTIIMVFYFGLNYEAIFVGAEALAWFLSPMCFPFVHGCSKEDILSSRHEFACGKQQVQPLPQLMMMWKNPNTDISPVFFSDIDAVQPVNLRPCWSQRPPSPLSKSSVYVSSLFQTAGSVSLMWPWYLLLLTYRAVGLWHSLSQQWSHILFVLALREAYSLAHPSAQRGRTKGHALQSEEEAPCDSSLFSVVIMMEMQPFSLQHMLQRGAFI